MDTILFITDLHTGSRIPELAGVREEAANLDWHVEEIEVQRLKHTIKAVLKYWKPIGCILEGSSNLLPSRRAFSRIPIVHIDPDDRMLEDGSVFTVENDDSAIAELAHRELARTDCTNFAFIGWSRRVRWSRRREDRFKDILTVQGHTCHTLEDPWTFGNKSDFVTRLRPFLKSLPKPCGIYQTASLFASLPDKTPPALLTDIYNAQLFTKGILLNSEIDFRRLLQKSGDKDVLNMYDELQTKRTELQKCYETQNSNKDSRSIKQLEDRIRQLNWAIVRKCKEYGDFTQNLSLTTDSVRRSLRPDEAAVELVETDVTLNNNPDHIYIALILRPGWNAPHACHLFFRSDIEKLNYPTGVPICQLLNDSTYQNRIYNDSKLGQLVWGNLLKELDGATHIYFAPSGIFHQWGIEYMPITDDGKRISDTLSVSRLSSTKLLAQRTDRSASLNTGEAVIFGGMDYEMSIGEMRKYNKAGKEEFYEDFSALAAAEEQLAAEQQAEASLAAAELPEELRGANTSAILSMTRQGELKFGKLKGANDEAETIERILRQAGVKATRYGAYGTEGAFKALNGHKISLLHIATHGFSYAVTEQDIPQIDWLKPYASSPLPTDPLCYSGLVFAGCNQKTQYHRDDFPTDINDGIVTAQEIAQLNLQDLQLTVLSACQTGLGELREDGVFGVQRGFKKAGAHTLVMSLWSVDDAATQLMMTSFYEALLSGLSRNDAFLKAQARVRDSFPDPHYWAPFIMLDDI